MKNLLSLVLLIGVMPGTRAWISKKKKRINYLPMFNRTRAKQIRRQATLRINDTKSHRLP